ncbi:GTP 3',8-cyclase MoaA, partial [Acidocella aminolytica]
SLIEGLSQYLGNGLEELTLTTNGSQLAKHAQGLAAAGVKRINVSLDTLDDAKFARVTRWGRLAQVLAGIEAAQAAGLAIKINMVALKGVNDEEFDTMLRWCGREGLDLCLIETMPMGEVTHREETHLPLIKVQADLAGRWTLHSSDYATGGPARYVTVGETGRRLGFITPLSHNFCESCNRVRLTCTGTLYMCLGQEDAVDLRKPLRASQDDTALDAAIHRGIAAKPKGHDFVIGRVAVPRHMSVTGG